MRCDFFPWRRKLFAAGIALLAATACGLAEPPLPSKNSDPIPEAASKKGLQVQMTDDALALGV